MEIAVVNCFINGSSNGMPPWEIPKTFLFFTTARKLKEMDVL
jgi:hypothetical protein